jgi:signal transduction histidine kinase
MGCLRRVACLPLALAAIWVSPPACAQARLTLEEVAERRPPDFTPVHAGENVIVRGVVSARVFHFPDHSLLAFEESGHGGVVQVPGSGREVASYQPGDQLEIAGTVSAAAGMVFIVPSKIRVLGHETPPTPQEVRVDDLLGFPHLGQLVRAEGRIGEMGETTAGTFLQISARKGNYRIFLPHGPGLPGVGLPNINVGDKVAAVGVANQYCTTPPYNRWFEMLVADPSQLVRTEGSWLVPPLGVAGAVAAFLVIGLFIWIRERRLDAQRERLRKSYQLGEAVSGASSIEMILQETRQALPYILGVSRVQIYIYNRATEKLDAVDSPGEPFSIPLSAPPGEMQAGAVACFHYRTLLVIPDLARSPFPIQPGPDQGSPKSMLFVPMLSQGEIAGVLELDQDEHARNFSSDEQALAQHLGNQIGVAIRLLDQRSVQEQLFRTEKLAAVGRLIAGVVNELQNPLASIEELANRALLKSHEREVSAIAVETQKASAIVSRLVSFAAAGQGEARPVCITTLLRNLIEFRERDWKASGIRVRDQASSEPLYVLGSHGQLEQAFLTLFVHAEQSMAEVPEKTITIRTSLLGKKLLVEIAFTPGMKERPPQETATVLGVTRSVIAGHGGEVRLIEKDHAQPRFEVELPLSARERAGVNGAMPAVPVGDGGRRLTALVIEPDDAMQRQLLALLSTRGLRVVPVPNADTGLDMAQRMRFDVALCSAHAPGLNWVELSEQLKSRVGVFILLSDRYDAELAADFEEDSRFVITKPVQEADLEHALESLLAPTLPTPP